jgi:arsenate reductase
MEIIDATSTFAALGSPGRLAVFRLLMRHAPQGVRPTEIAQSLDLKQNTLSHHLAALEQVGLIRHQRDGRSLFYTVDLDRAGALVAYLVNDCCRGRPGLCPALPETEAAMTRPYNVLFICSGNSARSIFAEAILNDLGAGRFRAFSAGTRPGTALNPYAITVLERAGHDVSGLRSKHISEFEQPDAPQMDFVFTVCDAAASEECAPWPGQPMTAHWGLPDPVKATGTDAEKALAFARTYAELHKRLTGFAALSFDQLDRLALQHRLDDLGHI